MPQAKQKQAKAQGPPQRRAFSYPTPAQVAREALDQPFKWRDAFPFPGVVVVMGDRGMGKTATAYWAMDQWHKARGVPASLYKAPRAMKRLMPEWVSAHQELASLPENSVVVIDEGQQHANSRRPGSAENLDMGNLVAMSRQRNQLLIILTHQSRKLDLTLVMDASRVIWKKPTHGHLLFERREMKPFTARALQAFEEVRGDPRQWAYVMDFRDLKFGMLKTGRPGWWDERMSTAMSGLGRG